jgi:hypothetical protein
MSVSEYFKITKVEVLPCPFCGTAPSVIETPDFFAIECLTVNCPTSKLSRGEWTDGYEKLRRWNTRA